MKKNGFTLIEALAVVSIIGVLATLTIYVVAQAQRQARDATRKSDVAAISEGFEARYADQTCSDSADVGHFPGQAILGLDPRDSTRYLWGRVSALSADNLCAHFTSYLPTIPIDPKIKQGREYYFDITRDFKHYRITASLEKPIGSSEATEINRQSDIWYNSFKGSKYDAFNSNGSCQSYNVNPTNTTFCYNYYSGR
ncbi:MAG TPA: prepilin-type N-terminal cleavage/methylation domain-containing protein [Candidatus Saccharimonadales bacterium]|nr:prepilin-type N-terminal cleavage/methylation domain-containing protein [Candidatus Saccharimonadales bacterium]